MVEFDVKKQTVDKPGIKRLEIEYQDMNYIIINLDENVIDYNGNIWEYSITLEKKKEILNKIWELDSINEFDYWPDKTKDHAPMKIMWRMSFYDEFDVYYHKSGVTKYPDGFMDLIKLLKDLK